MAILICLDPGHVKGYNQGAYTSYYEGTKMYDLAVMLKEEIEKYSGMTAFLTRTSPMDNPTLAQRGAMALAKKAKCFISLHSDACGTESVNRVSVFRSLTMPNSAELGSKLMNAVANTIGTDIPCTANSSVFTKDNGHGNDYYGVIRNSCGGSVKDSFIIEHGFHTNYKNSVWLYSDDNLRKLAIAEAKILAEHYGYSIKQTNSTTTDPKPTITVTTTTSNNNKAESYTKYTVRANDSWWKIAANKLGSGLKMRELAAYNDKTILSPLKAGDTIKIPTASKIAYNTYKVQRGDSWWKIAKNQMGDGNKFKELAEYNGMSTDDALTQGMTLKIPVS